jgi:hypothetical protein
VTSRMSRSISGLASSESHMASIIWQGQRNGSAQLEIGMLMFWSSSYINDKSLVYIGDWRSWEYRVWHLNSVADRNITFLAMPGMSLESIHDGESLWLPAQNIF